MTVDAAAAAYAGPVEVVRPGAALRHLSRWTGTGDGSITAPHRVQAWRDLTGGGPTNFDR